MTGDTTRQGMPMRNEYRKMPYRPPRETRKRKTGSASDNFRFLKQYLLPHKRMLALCIVLTSLNACSVYLQAYYARVVVDGILVIEPHAPPADTPSREMALPGRDRRPLPHLLPEHGAFSEHERAAQASRRPPGAMARLLGIFSLYLGTVVALNFAERMAARVRIRISQAITGRLREDMHQKILSLSRSFHQAHPPGRLMARILSDVNHVQALMINTFVTAASHVVMFLVGASLVLMLEPRLGVITCLVMIPYSLVIARFRPRIRNVHREAWHTNSCLWGLVSQKLDSIRAVFAYQRERHEMLNFHRLSGCFLRDALIRTRLGAGVSRAGQIIVGVTTIGIFLYCSRLVLHGSMSLGKMMYIYGASSHLFVPVMGLAQMSVSITSLFVIIQRLLHIFEEPLEIKEAPNAVDFHSRLTSGITVRHVAFGYGVDTEPVLRDVSLRVPAGQWLCIMGSSGSGKTTLLNLLARLYDPVSGDILVDGTPLSRFRFGSLRRHVAMVPQEAQIFRGSIRDNITYGDPEASPSQIMAAAKAAECHAFIMELPVQYESTIGEKGGTLSGGQRQRISIARALLAHPEVLLLDDCTSALDADTERRLQDTLSRLMAGKTTVIVSQRVSMAMRCHRICVLADGIVSESGTHAELLAKGGFYARLVAQQTE